MWALVLIFFFKDSYAGGMAATTIDNFTTQATCEAAGQAAIEDLDVFQHTEIEYVGLFNKTQTFKKGKFYHDSIRKSYKCIQVK